ncbi:xylulokinase [Chondrinema litorale]|uniref:xylulokinase n=1 Tax=Chondrinema litorale TaxID=2994555 RepID=UPI0025434572|nr:FGGY family carbohydrate kinase [Chondrinema litorale]UZR93239.1 FGGY family carbohydrate kinase [Chondrinema litorale]
MASSKILLGYDIGTSSIKLTALEADSGLVLSSATYPEEEMLLHSAEQGWAEQDPEMWWKCVVAATKMVVNEVPKEDIVAIGITYQMHGLVAVDKDMNVLRPSIIWCDSRAVEIGNNAFESIGEEYCLEHFLNSPGNFTASKLKWVKENEPETYEKIHKIMLPGDYIAMKMTNLIQTTVSGLSEGIMWDFKDGKIADKLLDYYGIDEALIPDVVETFSEQGTLTKQAAEELDLPQGIKITYRAGDQPNNAFSLNVLNPGELAATAGTSGVVYGITDSPDYDPESRVNTFVHVNHTKENPRYGVLLCVNGTGILNSWFKNNMTGLNKMSYAEMNEVISKAPVGARGLVILPFGNGAERVLGNKDVKSQINGLNFNLHDQAHMFRALQEGIVFALNYGFEVMQNMGIKLDTVKAGKANMFLSPIFRETFANVTGAAVELYNTDGSQGAARGAGVGLGHYASFSEAFSGLQTVLTVEPDQNEAGKYKEAYDHWLEVLKQYL